MCSRRRKPVALVDADLLCNGTRHPNLVLLKLAGFLHDNEIPFELVLDENIDVEKYRRIFISRVFTFTKLPLFYLKAIGTNAEKKIAVGGTGFYANETNVSVYRKKRTEDMMRLEKDSFLNQFPNKRGGYKSKGVDMARQMPYYHLYDSYVDKQIAAGARRDKYKDYLDYSIGFLTRGCIRHCPFCVNKLEDIIVPYSKIEWFLDTEKDDKGRDIRPFVYLWDDNFLASDKSVWKPLLEQLNALKKPFQFRQGLDERMLAQSPDGEEMAELLSKSRYHGDFIFAFDNWRDRPIIEKALKIWKKHNPKKSTKFYLFCGFKQSEANFQMFYKDIWELFQRIKVLMQYGCVGYVMRHEDYHKAPIPNFYVQIARWCNQQQFYKKMSFWEFSYRNQTYWEEKTLGLVPEVKLKSFSDFMADYNAGYYTDKKICKPLETILLILDAFPEHRDELLEMFDYKMVKLENPSLWN